VKAFLILGGIAVLAVVAVAVSKSSHFYAYSEVTDAQGKTSVHCFTGCDVVDSITGGASTPEIDDALAIAQTAGDPAYRDATHGMDALLRRASRMSHRSGAALVWKRAPSLIVILDAEQTRILDRMRGLTMSTQAGELCRRAALRVISRYQWSTRDRGADGCAGGARPCHGRRLTRIRLAWARAVERVEGAGQEIRPRQ
jgi:hypothetical protein